VYLKKIKADKKNKINIISLLSRNWQYHPVNQNLHTHTAKGERGQSYCFKQTSKFN
jgi:hypothetical protein